jgi:hypothetical protein
MATVSACGFVLITSSLDSYPQLVVDDKKENVDFSWLSITDSTPLLLNRIEEVLSKWAWGLGRGEASSMSSPFKVLARSI